MMPCSSWGEGGGVLLISGWVSWWKRSRRSWVVRCSRAFAQGSREGLLPDGSRLLFSVYCGGLLLRRRGQ